MKHLLMIALFAISGLTANAQADNFYNNSSCSLRIRVICIDETNCTHSVPIGSTWVDLPPGMNTAIPSATSGLCGAGTVQGYEIQYHPSTGCTDSVFYTTNPATPCSHSQYYVVDYHMPGCASCSPQDFTWIHYEINSNDFVAEDR